jgi:DNA-directed RNA polymerase subunit RPC12/RpoP
MGREYITSEELELEKCPYCGSTRLRVEVARKVIYEEVWDAGNSYTTLDSDPLDVEWEVIYGVECADCGEDLSEEAGL